MEVHKALNDANYVLGLYLDLSKAFDTVDHSLLLKKLYWYGIRGTTHEWFSSYLSNRKQYVHINGVKSAQYKIEIGVPQGSVLGSLKFLLYINDIVNSVKKHPCKIMLFADDTNVFIVHKHPIMLKQLAEVIMSDLCATGLSPRLTES